jgi:hypothetical protein
MLVFFLPMVCWFAMAGAVLGLAAGRRLTGRWSDALALALWLGMSPVLAFWLARSYGFLYESGTIKEGRLMLRADRIHPQR